MKLTQKSTLGDLANALDPAFNADASALGAVRLLSALATKSQTAANALAGLQTAAADALRELGFANAAKDAGDAQALAEFAPVAAVADVNFDDGDAGEDAGDDETAGQVAQALDAIVETTKSIAQSVEALDARVSAFEGTKGNSFGRDWEDFDSNYVPAKKSAGDMWSGSAFDFNA